MRPTSSGRMISMRQCLGHREAGLTTQMGEVRHVEALGPIYRAGGGGTRLVGEVNDADGGGLSMLSW
jgi:hypothetical protein